MVILASSLFCRKISWWLLLTVDQISKNLISQHGKHSIYCLIFPSIGLWQDCFYSHAFSVPDVLLHSVKRLDEEYMDASIPSFFPQYPKVELWGRWIVQ